MAGVTSRRTWRETLRQTRSRDEAVERGRALPESPIKLPRRLKPFTVGHFAAFAGHLRLDSGEWWRPEHFQLAFLADVFAGVPEDWFVVPEGNGKTTLVAGLSLYVCEYSRRIMEIPVAASAMEQARILYRQAEGFVLRSPVLHDEVYSSIQEAKGKQKLAVPRFTVLPGYRRIEHYRGSRIQIVAADDRTGDGVIFGLAILDELHRHRDLDLYRTWVGKRQKLGGQIIAISTAGEPGGEFEETRQRIRQGATSITREGAHVRAASPEVVLHEWAVAATADVEDIAEVKAANPFSKVTVESLKSKRRSPTMTLQHWRRFTCNLPTRSENAAIQEAEWFAAATSQRIPPGEPIWLGLDLGWKWDTTAAVPLWEGPEFRLLGPARILVPPRDGTQLDPQRVKDALAEIHAVNPIHTVVMDMTGGADIAAWIEAELGVEAVIDRGQGAEALALDYARFMESLRGGTLKHCGDPGLTRHVLTAIARTGAGGKARFDTPTHSGAMKRGDAPRKVIDALQAAAMVNSSAVAGVDLAANIW